MRVARLLVHACTALFIVVFNNALNAQTIPSATADRVNKLMPRPIMQSPDVASLGKYGEYQVSHYTGVPQISIPLYEATSGNLKIPITLSYHAAGFRVADQSGWVGFGWSLASGGQVSRKVQNVEDEDYYTTHALQTSLSNCTTYAFLRDAELGITDPQPDVFSYSFSNGGGNFLLGPNGQAPYLFPYRNYLFQTANPNDKFEIIDDNGILYRYGKNAAAATAYESSTSYSGGITKTYRTAWKLMEVIAPNADDKISISYQSSGGSHSMDKSYSYSITNPCQPYAISPTPCDLTTQTSLETNASSTDLNPSEILFEGGKVQFILRTDDRLDMSGTKALDEVRIYSLLNGTYTLVKYYKFKYSYFTNAAGTTNLRLRLDELWTLDNLGVVQAKHTFEYFTDTFLTSYDAIDYWGYYNGRANSNSIPYQTVTINGTPTQIGGADRTTDTTYMKQAVLRRINFPTCGFSEFDFDTNSYSESGVTKYAGGLRVKKIVSKTGCESPTIAKTYKYGISESGNGVKNFTLKDGFFKTSEAYVTKACVDVSPGTDCVWTKVQWSSTTYFSNSTVSMTPGDGSPVVYTEVVEYLGDPTTNIGKTKYVYDNNGYEGDYVYFVPFASGKNYVNTKDWKRGKLTATYVYDKNGNILTESTTTYQLLKQKSRVVGALTNPNTNWFNGMHIVPPYSYCTNEISDYRDDNEFYIMYITQSSGALVPVTTTEKVYQQGVATRSVDVTRTHVYDTANFLSIEQASSAALDGEVVVTKTKYPASYSIPGGTLTGVPKAIKKLKDKNIWTVPIEQYTLRQNSNGTNARVIAGQISTFKENPNNTNYVQPDEIFIYETDAPVASGSYTTSALTTSALTKDSKYKSRIKFTTFSALGNVVEVNKVDDNSVVYIWDYSETLPIAQVANAANADVAYTSFEADGKGNWTFTGATSTSSQSVTGLRKYKLYNSGNLITKSGLTAGKTYTLSFWYAPGTAPTVTLPGGGTQGTPLTYTGLNGWILSTRTISGATSIQIAGTASGIDVDELRLHPADAQMTSYTYDPALGITTATDAKNMIAYYEYDAAGRLKLIRDQQGNIVKTFQYHYSVQP